MRRAPHLALEGLWGQQGDHATARLGPHRLHLLGDPEVCRALLRAGEDEQKKSFFYDKLQPIFGQGSLTAQGEAWRRNRAMVQPLLTPRAVQTYAPVIVATTERLIARWREAAARGDLVDAAEGAAFVAREVTVRALFGDASEAANAELTEALATLEAWIAKRFWALVDPEHYWSPARTRQRAAAAAVDALVYGLIERRRTDGSDTDDLLSRLVRARDDAGALSERQLRDEVTTLYLAGQETTAQALAFTLWLVARHPEAQTRLREEVRDAVADRSPTGDEARRLVWTRACVEESLRLYPPVWSFGRETLCPFQAGAVRLSAGTTCVVAPWVLHRRPDLWDDPAVFRPERFLGQSASRAFIPFGAGPRNCVGRDLAMLELVLATAMLVRAFHLEDCTPEPVTAAALVSLKPEPAPLLAVAA